MRFLPLIAAIFLAALPARAEDLEVDVELVFAVDVSRSMTRGELEIQRRGYAEALTSPEVIEAIENGLIGRIAVAYIEWAGTYSQRTIVDWTLIEGAQEARHVADRLTAHFDSTLRRTSISGALEAAAWLFVDNGYHGLRRVIDVSGDGPNNEGRPVLAARADVLAEGIIINGLPLMTRDGYNPRWHLEDLDVYYRNCVIGGPGAFVIPVLDWADFPAAVRRKMVLEIAGLMPRAGPRVIPAQGYDCLVGEKLWQRNRGDFFIP